MTGGRSVPALNCSQVFVKPCVVGALAQIFIFTGSKRLSVIVGDNSPPLPFSLQESRPFSVDFFRKIIQFEKEQVSVLSMHFLSGKMY